jgi:hypothetical protein
MASDEEYEKRYAAEQDAKYAARYAAEIAAPKKEVYDDPIPSIPWGDIAAGAVRGAGSVGATLMAPIDYLGEKLPGWLKPELAMTDRRKKMDEGMQAMGADPESTAYGVGKFGAEVAGTLGAGGTIANLLRGAVPSATRLATAIETMGGTAGPGGSAGWTAANRVAGGGISGGAMSGLADPEHAGFGAGIGAAIPVAGALIGKGVEFGGFLKDLASGTLGKVRASQIAKDAAGGNLARIQAVNAAANPKLTAAQAAAGIDQDAYQAMGKYAQVNDGTTFFRPHADAAQAARGDVMSGMARGSSGEDAALARDLFSKMSAAELVPIRESILGKLRQTGKTLDEILPLLSQKEAMYISSLQSQGARTAEAAQAVSGTTGRVGVRPNPEFSADPAIQELQSITRQGIPVARNLPPSQGILKAPDTSLAASKMSDAATEGGVASSTRTEADALRAQISALPSAFTAAPIRDVVAARAARSVNPSEETVMNAVLKALQRAGDDPVAIAEVRRLGVNQIMGDLLNTGKLSKTDAAAALGEVKGLIDKQLGPEIVKRYFKPYSKKLEYRDSLELMDKLRQLQKDSPTKFLRVMEGNDPKLVAKYGDWETLQQAIGARRLGKAQGVAGEMTRDINIGKQAEAGMPAFGRILAKDEGLLRLPGFISWVASTANKFVAGVEKTVNQQTLDAIIEGMKSGASANQLLATVPAHERNAIALGLTKSGYNTGIGAFSTTAARQSK